jgi:hypothetical protein
MNKRLPPFSEVPLAAVALAELRVCMPPELDVTALFTGEKGTGRTLAAQVLARDLRQDLYRIDLSSDCEVLRRAGHTAKRINIHQRRARASVCCSYRQQQRRVTGSRKRLLRVRPDRFPRAGAVVVAPLPLSHFAARARRPPEPKERLGAPRASSRVHPPSESVVAKQ